MLLDASKCFGEVASRPAWKVESLDFHAKILWSSEAFMISSCSLMNALPFSPYRRGMLMSNIPRSEYAISSSLVVSLFDAHDILSAILQTLG
jgi:hypothetical protein